MKVAAVIVAGLLLILGPAEAPKNYVENPHAPDLTDCSKYWYYKDCRP